MALGQNPIHFNCANECRCTCADGHGAGRGLKACTKLDMADCDGTESLGWLIGSETESGCCWLTNSGLIGSGRLLAGSRLEKGSSGTGAKQWASGSGDGM